MILNKQVGLVLPTRYHSERLPGKVLIDINGKPNLERIIERALRSEYIDIVVLAISDEESKEIKEWYYESDYCISKKVDIFFGSHANIFQRTLNAIKYYNIDIIVDISHCCSFFDPILADILIQRLIQYKADYSSNCITRSFPDGFDCQIYTREIYEKIFNESTNWKPYWTGWNIFHCREDLWPKPRIINLEASSDYYYPEIRLTLDTPEDLNIITWIYKHFDDKIISPDYRQIINYIESDLDLLKAVKNNQTIPTKLEKENI